MSRLSSDPPQYEKYSTASYLRKYYKQSFAIKLIQIYNLSLTTDLEFVSKTTTINSTCEPGIIVTTTLLRELSTRFH